MKPHLLLALPLLITATDLRAQAGALDPGFAIGGRSTTNVLAGAYDEAWAVALQPDGGVLIAGTSGFEDMQDLALVRLLANGQLDMDFGDNGRVLTSVAPGNDVARAVAVRPDGSIVIAGYASRPEGLCFVLAAYQSNGDPVQDFGSNGVVVTDLAGGATLQGMALALQGDHILLAGGGNAGFAVVRYDASGAVDPTFGTDGLATCSFTGGNDLAAGIGFQSDGRIVCAGYSSGNADSIAVARFSVDGLLDASFGVNGRARAAITSGGTIGRGLAIDAQDRILVAGTTPTEAVAVRFTPDGTLDPAFNGTGIRELALDDANATAGYAIAVDSEGHILVAGRATYTITDFLLFRLNDDGSNDPAFDGDGVVTTAFNTSPTIAHAIAVQPDGRIVLAGSEDFDHGDFAFAAARYLAAEPTGITANIGRGEFVLGPNPAASTVTLRPEHADTHFYLLCYDALGRNILSTEMRGNTTVDVSTWPNGAYMLSTMNERGTSLGVHRLIVAH